MNQVNKFFVAATLAVAFGFGTADKADAQIVYGYSAPVGGGVYSTGTIYNNFGTAYKSYESFYSPFTGIAQKQVYGADVFGNSFGRSSGYNNFTGQSYRGGFYQPNPYVNPFGGTNYGSFNNGFNNGFNYGGNYPNFNSMPSVFYGRRLY